MKLPICPSLIAALGMISLVWTGCGRKHHEAGHVHRDEDGHHHHDEKPEPGASFKPEQGLLLTAETRQSLGVEVAKVSARTLHLEVKFNAQVFGENHRPAADETHHADCTAKAAGLVAQTKGARILPGQGAHVVTKTGEPFGGVILGLNQTLGFGDMEVLVGITNSGARLKPGDFLSVTIPIPLGQPVTSIPKSAVLRSAEGTFAYTLIGDAYHRTAIKTGAETGEFVEVKEGLVEGDVVVTKPVEKLWLIELRATKGGGHSH